MERKDINTNEINREAWNAYQETYAKAAIADPERNYFDFFANGGVDMDDYEPILSSLGDVSGLKVLDTCCSADAWQAYSWHNLGAKVTACDITPKAIEVASRNAEKMGLDIEFVEADMQTLKPIADNQFDIVFATYPVWVQDFYEACRTWHRVLKTGGKLLLFSAHPIALCIEESETGEIILHNYNEKSGKAEWYDNFDGTPMADHIGGFNIDLPSVEHFWGIADMLNGICDADFCIKKVYENFCIDKERDDPSNIDKMPSGFSVIAIKQ